MNNIFFTLIWDECIIIVIERYNSNSRQTNNQKGGPESFVGLMKSYKKNIMVFAKSEIALKGKSTVVLL